MSAPPDPATPRRTAGWRLAPYADNSAAFVFSREPIGVRVLDRVTWFVLELCDGRTVGEIVDRAETVLGARAGLGQIVAQRVQRLAAGGLITIEAGRSR